MIGSISVVNGQVMLRGIPEDFDQWAGLDPTEWPSSNLMPELSQTGSDSEHGGPIRASQEDPSGTDPRGEQRTTSTYRVLLWSVFLVQFR